MRRIREVLRQRWECGLSERTVAVSCGLAAQYGGQVRPAGPGGGLILAAAGIHDRRETGALSLSQCLCCGGWRPLRAGLGGGSIVNSPEKASRCSWCGRSIRRAHPKGFQYTQFCVRYRAWRETLDVPMRQEHKAGEAMFVDYCGQTMPVTDRKDGEIRSAQIFVAVLGASNYTYVEAFWTQRLPEWIMAHVRVFSFYGGGPRSDRLR